MVPFTYPLGDINNIKYQQDRLEEDNIVRFLSLVLY